MSQRDVRFPFSAVVGMDNAKKAIQCMIVNPSIRSILIEGAAGTAKTLLARSIENISGRSIINIPLNVGDEQVFGCVDVEKTMLSGKLTESDGLLDRANGNIAYIDDINLMDGKLLSQIQDIVMTKEILLEREGLSKRKICDTSLIGTMNMDESDISPAIMDRFDIFIHSSIFETPDERKEVLRRNEEYIADPERFMEEYRSEEDAIINNIERAKALLPLVDMEDEVMDLIVELCIRSGCLGHRGEISMANASMALAALDGRTSVTKNDIKDAAEMCLIHRRNPRPPQTEVQEPEPEERDPSYEQDGRDEQNEPCENREHQEKGEDDEGSEEKDSSDNKPSVEDLVFDVGETFKVIDYIRQKNSNRKASSRKGRRTVSEIKGQSGRYARAMVSDDHRDIAFDATVRAAAPHQKQRHRDGMSVVIESQDLREKVRERRCGCTILFLVDASGSLGAKKRMVAVKGAILSMLRDSYVRRDHIGMMAFRRKDTEVILPPTRSVEYSYKKLEEMPTGGKTPLAKALVDAERYMSSYSRAHPGEKCYVVLITDGKANVPLKEGTNAGEEAFEIAGSIHVPGVSWVVIDAESGRMRLGNAAELAERLSGDYFRLEDMNADSLARMVGGIIG